MLFRRFAFAVGLLVAFLASQLPEFTQQYRQRLGGAIDELSAEVTRFDGDAAAQSLTREQGIARLEGNGDALAQARGQSMAATVERRDRLDRQRTALGTAGPVSQYAVLADGFDAGIARQTLSDFQPAVPATTAGFIAAVIGFFLGWLITHIVAVPVRMRPRRRKAAVQEA